MESDEMTIHEKKKLLYTYWHELPFRKMFSTISYFKLQKSDIKHFIAKYLRDGVEDEFGQQHGLSRRHAFTAKELKDAYDKRRTNQEYSISNFHFHIKNMVEEGYLKELTKILEGRHYITYYGRTAKLFDPEIDQDMNNFIEDNIINPLKLISKALHPEVEPETIEEAFELNKKLLSEFYDGLGQWTEDMYPYIYDAKLDLAEIDHYVAHFALLNKTLQDNLKDIAKLTGLDRYLDPKYNSDKEE